MLKPKSKKDKEFFLVDYSIITGTKSSFDYFCIMIKLRCEDVSKRMSDSITGEQIEKMIRNIYNNADFNKYDKYNKTLHLRKI